MAVPDLQDALDCLQQKDVDTAIELLEAKIDELPAHLTAHVLLARAFETKKEWSRALNCWENAHFLMPNSPVAREGKQRVLAKMEEPPDEHTEDETGEQVDTHAERADSETAARDVEEPEPPESAQPSAPDRPPSPGDDGPSSLDELRQQTEQESRRPPRTDEAAGGEEPPSSPSAASAEADAPTDRLEALDEQSNGDLDQLIEELESARIEPDPDVDEVEPPDLSHDVEDLVSETLARIYEAQDQFREAAQIYVKLASQEPDQARSYLERAAEMREKAEEQANTGD